MVSQLIGMVPSTATFGCRNKNNSYRRLIVYYMPSIFYLLRILMSSNSHNSSEVRGIILTPDYLLTACLTFPRSHQNVNINTNCNTERKTFSLCCIPLFLCGSWILIRWGESFYGASNVYGHPLPCQGQGQRQQQKERCSGHR